MAFWSTLKLVVVLGVTPVLPHNFSPRDGTGAKGISGYAFPRMAPLPPPLGVPRIHNLLLLDWRAPHLRELVQDARNELMRNLGIKSVVPVPMLLSATCLALGAFNWRGHWVKYFNGTKYRELEDLEIAALEEFCHFSSVPTSGSSCGTMRWG
jgi:hypothetical protein